MERNKEEEIEEIESRRKKVARLYNEGKSNKEIEEELGLSDSTVYRDIKVLIEEGVIEARTEKRDETRRKVARLYIEGKSYKEIAEELGMSMGTVKYDLMFLKKSGMLGDSSRRKNKSEINARREKVARLYKEGKKPKRISEELGVPIQIVEYDLKYLKKKGVLEMTSKKVAQEIARRRKEVARLYNEGKNAKEISEELGMSYYTICRDIKELIKKGMLEKRDRKIHDIDGKIAERRDEVARLYREGKTKKGIAEELGVSAFTIYQDIKALEEQGIIEARTKKSDRRREVARLYNEGKSYKEIAEELGLSIGAITYDVTCLKENGMLKYSMKSKKESEINARKEKVARLYNEGKSTKEIAEELKVDVSTVRSYIRDLKKAGIIVDDEQQNGEDNGSKMTKKMVNTLVGERNEKIKKLYEEGLTMAEVAKRVNLTPSQAKEIYLSLGLSIYTEEELERMRRQEEERVRRKEKRKRKKQEEEQAKKVAEESRQAKNDEQEGPVLSSLVDIARKVKGYIKNGELEEAEKLSESYMGADFLSEEDKDKLNKLVDLIKSVRSKNKEGHIDEAR